MSRARIAVTTGEPAGIGPEIALAAVAAVPDVELTLVGDSALLAECARRAGLRWPPPAPVSVHHVPLAASARPGRLDPRNARYVLAVLDHAIDGALSGEYDAVVTAPVQKSVINDAGIPFTGHTEHLARRAHAQVVMMLAGDTPHGPLRVALATTHLPLAQVPAALTVAGLEAVLQVLLHDLVAHFGIAAPRVAVTGLNPHAGEGGHLGREEIDVIAPAIARARAKGIDAVGPMPSDTVFVAAKRGDYDAVVTMYHDQGQIAMKLMGFDKGVTLHGGLPVPVTTCASGTAFDIVGRNVANVEGLQQAFDLAVAIASRAGDLIADATPPRTARR
jgi:4-hydroxythreonine-4-phosphate dehydrogenase